MIRIRRGVEILHVAGGAIGGRSCIFSTKVALRTLQRGVHPRQGKTGERSVVKLRSAPGSGRVAHAAVARKPGLQVTRIGRAVVVLRVASEARDRGSLRETADVT